MGGRERREVIEPCASKWMMKIQRGAAETGRGGAGGAGAERAD